MAEERETIPTEKQTVLASDALEDRMLLRYAEGALSVEERAAVEARLERSPEEAVYAAELKRICAPVRRLHNAGFLSLAWQHLRGGGHLSPKREVAWKLHRRDCEPCRKRAVRLERIGIRAEGQSEGRGGVPNRMAPSGLSRAMTPALSFGLGLLAMFVFSHPASLHQTPNGSTKPNMGETERNVAPLIDLSAGGTLRALLVPVEGNPARQQNQIKTWEGLPTELDLEKQAALGGFYQRMAQEERHAGRRAELLRKSRESLLRAQAEIAHRLQNLESPLNGTSGGTP